MRLQIIVYALAVYLLPNSSQAQILERQIIASAGSSNGFTIGEVIVETDNIIVTVGFQQGEVLEEETPLQAQDISASLEVFPVPTRDILNIRGAELSSSDTNVKLYSLNGRLMEVSIETVINQIKLDLRNLPAGNYYLRLNDSIHQKTANYKILKIK